MHFTTTQHERIIVDLPLYVYCLISDVVYMHIEFLIVGYQQLACTSCVVNAFLGNPYTVWKGSCQGSYIDVMKFDWIKVGTLNLECL